MVSMIIVSLYNIIDTFWVAKIGHEAIAALTVVLPYHIFIIAVSWLLSMFEGTGG